MVISSHRTGAGNSAGILNFYACFAHNLYLYMFSALLNMYFAGTTGNVRTHNNGVPPLLTARFMRGGGVTTLVDHYINPNCRGKYFRLPPHLSPYYNEPRATAHMDGILDFAVCIWSWLLVLGTRPIGREIAYKKIQRWNRWDDRIRMDLLWKWRGYAL